MKPLVLLPLALSIAGCAFPMGESRYLNRSDTTPVSSSGAPGITVTPVSAGGERPASTISDALLLLGVEAGTVTRIRERHHPNGTRQEIVLQGDRGTHGENVLDVSLRTSGGDNPGYGMLQIGKPSERGIRNEIISRFPDVKMNIVTRSMRNSFGDFGLAIGKRADGSRCVFAWQWIDDIREAAPRESGFARMGSMLSFTRAPVSVRVRLCRMDKTVDQLAAYVEGMMAGDAAALERLMKLDRRNLSPATAQTAGGASAPADTGATTLEAALGGGAPPRVQTAAAPERAAAPVRQASRRASPRRTAEKTEAPAPVAAAPVAPVEQPYAGGPRYMAPVQGGAPPSVATAAPAAAPPAVRRLDPSLPAQAYRGPSSTAIYRPPGT